MEKIKVGHEVITDGRLNRGGVFEKLQTSDWAPAEFVFPGKDGIPDLALTGKVVRYDAPKLGGVPVVRVQVTFVGDGEPSQIAHGWARAKGLAY
jgi:hypothetical protein